MSSSIDTNGNSYQNLEAKRRQNIEDNRRFLAALKINDIRDEIKEITNNNNTDPEGINTGGRRAVKKEVPSDIVRRGSRIRKNITQIENIPPVDEKRKKKTSKNIEENHPKVKLQLPEHMLIRYQSTGRKVALHNTKAKFGDDDNENAIM